MIMSTYKLAQSIGIPLESICFERGLSLRTDGNRWFTHSNSNSGPVIIDQNDQNEIERRLRPILIRCKNKNDVQPVDFLLHPKSGFAPRPIPNIDSHLMFIEMAAIQYVSEAVIYHFAGMVKAYENICDSFKNTTLIPGFPQIKICNCQGQPEPYYEFDALLGAVRRGYDSCRYLLWKVFGPSKGSVPRSFEKTLPYCSRLNASLIKKLKRSWDTWGSITTNYRDCIHHYVPLDFGMSTVTVSESFPGVWTAFARVPDNPEARSKTKFTYKKHLDALTFGWHIAVEVLTVMNAIVAAVRAEAKSGLTSI